MLTFVRTDLFTDLQYKNCHVINEPMIELSCMGIIVTDYMQPTEVCYKEGLTIVSFI